jgi:putative membrane protein
MKADKFFSGEEKQRIAETTKAAEARTDGEIAVMVVDRSDPYRETEVLGGVIFGGLLALVLSIVFFHESLFYFIPLAFIFFFPFRWLGKKYPYLKPIFIGRQRVEETVRQRALQAFYEKGLYKTRFQTGILIFISLFEHIVWILADKGIYEKMHQDSLDRFAKKISQGLKEGRACETLCQTIKEMGGILSQHFPLSPGDTNELPDTVILEK